MSGDKGKGKVKDDPKFLVLGHHQADGETLNRTELLI